MTHQPRAVPTIERPSSGPPQAEVAGGDAGRQDPFARPEDVHRIVADGAFDWELLLDRDGRVRYCSPSSARITGHDAAEFVAGGDLVLELVHPDDRELLLRHRERVELGESSADFEYRMLVAGRTVWVGHACRPVFDAAGARIGTRVSNRDVTALKMADAELRGAARYARSLLEASLDPLVTISPEGKITDVNTATEEATGRARAALLGTDFADYFTEPERARDGYRRVLERGLVRDYPLTLRSALGRETDVLYNASVYRSESGELQGVFAAARDVTDLRRAIRALERQRDFNAKVLGTVASLVIVLDLEARIVLFNRACEQCTGWSFDEVADRPFFEVLVPEAEREAVGGVWRALAASALPSRFENHWVTRGGELRLIEFANTTLSASDGEVEFIIAAGTDVTDRRRAEQELRASEEALHGLNAELERRVAERTAELEAANQELEGFSSSVSHDLRAPLRAIDGYARIVLDTYADRLDDEGRRLLGVVRESTVRMAQLIDDILAFSRARRLELRLADVDMNMLVGFVWQDLEPARAGREIELAVGPLPWVRGDPAMLRQVLANLLGNAVKFTAPRAVAHVEIGAHVSGAMASFFVKDDGVGFDARHASQMFGVFQRLHRVDEFEGTGIGLAIVKRIVSRHGGEVSAEGGVGEGATLRFTLPIAKGGAIA